MRFADGVEVVGLDGDDTLWLCQDGFDEAEVELGRLLADWADGDEVVRTLNAVARDNLPLYGYGVKAWSLNAVQTAVSLSGGTVPADVLQAVVDLGRGLLAAPVELLPGAQAAVDALAGTHRVVLVTKGDLVDQRRKLRLSGLADRFDHVEIVPDKHEGAYEELLRFLEVPADRFLMVGNSEVSDVAPVLAIGSWAVHVPHTTTWELERSAAPLDHPRRATVRSLGEVPSLLQAERL